MEGILVDRAVRNVSYSVRSLVLYDFARGFLRLVLETENLSDGTHLVDRVVRSGLGSCTYDLYFNF